MCKISLHFYDLLLNANVCDLFYDIDNLDFAYFSDILGQLKGGIGKIFDWFKKNVLKGNADKCHLITSSLRAHVGFTQPIFY